MPAAQDDQLVEFLLAVGTKQSLRAPGSEALVHKLAKDPDAVVTFVPMRIIIPGTNAGNDGHVDALEDTP